MEDKSIKKLLEKARYYLVPYLGHIEDWSTDSEKDLAEIEDVKTLIKAIEAVSKKEENK